MEHQLFLVAAFVAHNFHKVWKVSYLCRVENKKILKGHGKHKQGLSAFIMCNGNPDQYIRI